MSFNFSPPTHVSLVRRLPAAFPPCRGDSLCEREPPPHPQENARGGSPLDSRTFLLESPLRNTRPCNGAAKPRFHRLSTWSAPISAQPLVQCGFVSLCNLSPPLPLCGGVSDKTHMSFRTRYAAAAERNKKHTKSSEAPAPPYCSQKVGFPRQSGGQGACPLCFSGGRAGGGLFQKRPSLAGRQRASALFVSRAALGTPRAAPRKAGSLSQRDHPLLAARGRQPF